MDSAAKVPTQVVTMWPCECEKLQSDCFRDNSWAYECSDDLGLVTKDMTKAMELKDKGNELFKANQLMEAKEMYTQALQHCPFDESDPSKNQEYSVILANRSAVTDKVYLYSAALQDVDLALKYNYPKQLLFKV